MNPQTRNRLMLHSHHKAHRLEADVARLAEVLGLILTLAEKPAEQAAAAGRLNRIARLARAGLVGATPAAAALTRQTG
jgi:hypothetical protein